VASVLGVAPIAINTIAQVMALADHLSDDRANEVAMRGIGDALSHSLAEARRETEGHYLIHTLVSRTVLATFRDTPRWEVVRRAAVEVLKSMPDPPVEHLVAAREALIGAALSEEHRREEYLGIMAALGQTLMTTEGYASAAARRAFDDARRALADRWDSPEGIRVMRGMWTFHLGRAEFSEAMDIAQRLSTLGRTKGDPIIGIEASWARAVISYYAGSLKEAENHLNECINAYEPSMDAVLIGRYQQHSAILARSLRALVYSQRGLVDTALQETDEALKEARRVGHEFTLIVTLCYCGAPGSSRGRRRSTLQRGGASTLSHTRVSALESRRPKHSRLGNRLCRRTRGWDSRNGARL